MADQDPSTRGTGTGSGSTHNTPGSKGTGGTSKTPGKTTPGSSGEQRTPGQAVAGEYICVFWLGGKPYALDVVCVAEVVAVQAVTPVPLTPSTVLGMQNLRGTALAIVDLGKILGLPSATEHFGRTTDTLMVLVLRFGGKLVGVRIDRVQAVYEFEKEKLRPSVAQAEHPAVQGLLELTGKGGVVATLLSGDEISRRIDALRFQEGGHVAAGA